MLNIKILISTFLFLNVAGAISYSQALQWTGKSLNGDFFDENNWVNTESGITPEPGTVDPGKAINIDLSINGNKNVISADGEIVLGTCNMYVKEATLKAASLSEGIVELDTNAYIDISDPDPLRSNISINLLAGLTWVRTFQTSASDFLNNYISNIKVNGEQPEYKKNIRIDNYYLNGAIVRGNDVKGAAVIYEKTGLKGDSALLRVDSIYMGDAIPSGLHNKISSIVLKKGYQLVVARFPDGTGLSKVFIASEDDLEISDLGELDDEISFIRIVSWNWSVKKGTGGNIQGLNNTWFYSWSSTGYQDINREYVPMAWGAGGINDETDINTFINKYKATHALGFNEPDDCDEQSGQYYNLCKVYMAIKYYQNLMKTGLRLVSPACHEHQALGWLKTFFNAAKDNNIRIDVIAVHWYDWASNPTASPNADPKKVFARFKEYLQDVHDYYNLPIWITEFNANPNRTTYVNEEFMKLALPYLESLDYVERYAWFQPSSGVADFYDGNGNLTNVGAIYKNQISEPAVSERTLICKSNLDGNTTHSVYFSDYFEEYKDGQDIKDFYTTWNGNSLAVDDDVTNDYGYAYERDGFGRAKITKNDYYLRKTFKLEAGRTYEWTLASKAPEGSKHVMKVLPTDVYPQIVCTNQDWEKHTIDFTVTSDNTEVTLVLYMWSIKPLYFDNYVLEEIGEPSRITDDVKEEPKITVFPNPVKGILHIKMDLDESKKADIYNISGCLVKSILTDGEINVSDLKRGVYILKIDNHLIKFVKI